MTEQDRKTLEQKGFEGIGKMSRRVGDGGASFMDRLFSRWIRHPGQDSWAGKADWAQWQQEPIRTRILLYLIVLTLAALMTWAWFAPLDEVTRGEGKVISSRQLQVVQSLDGGVVSEIRVQEGQIVEQGELLLSIDPTRMMSDFREQRVQVSALMAEVTRLRALVNDTPLVFDEALTESAPGVVEDEHKLYWSSLKELEEQKTIYEQQRQQREQDLLEARAAHTQYQTVLRLTRQELNATRPLLPSGAVSEMDLIRLERDIANAEGELARTQAAITRSQAAIRESDSRLREAEVSLKNRWRKELAESSARLSSLTESQVGLQDRVQRTEIRAPVSGIVQRLMTNTLGGVVTPGRDIVEIVPLGDQLLIEARIHPRDIAFLRPGQPAMIKFTAYDFNVFGGLDARVEHISADTITNDQDETFYLVRLRTEQEGFSSSMPIIPGMTAQVDIITGKKTVMEYLLKPVLRATSEAMTER